MKICFWGEIGDALKGTTIGGGELQMSLLAKALAIAGHDVVVIDPFSKESFISEEGVKVIHVPAWNKGLPGIRLFWYRIPALYRLFVSQKADYYYVRMRSYFHLLPFLAARKVKGKFLLAIASDIDLLGLKKQYVYQYKANFRLGKYLAQWLPNDIVFRYLLKKADYIFRQHSGQQINGIRVKGKVIEFPNLIDRRNLPVERASSQEYFIYVGSLAMIKGADKLYEVIRNAGKTTMIMVVGQPNDRGSVPIYRQIEKLANADVKGRNKHSDTLRLLANAKALINTSDYEGFPNVFLEAWAIGVPVLSLKVNPGNIFDKHNLGICFDGDLKKMQDYINRNEAPVISKEILDSYIIKFHDFADAGYRFYSKLTSKNHDKITSI